MNSSFFLSLIFLQEFLFYYPAFFHKNHYWAIFSWMIGGIWSRWWDGKAELWTQLSHSVYKTMAFTEEQLPCLQGCCHGSALVLPDSGSAKDGFWPNWVFIPLLGCIDMILNTISKNSFIGLKPSNSVFGFHMMGYFCSMTESRWVNWWFWNWMENHAVSWVFSKMIFLYYWSFFCKSLEFAAYAFLLVWFVKLMSNPQRINISTGKSTSLCLSLFSFFIQYIRTYIFL